MSGSRLASTEQLDGLVWGEKSYSWMLVRKGIINCHVLEVWLHISLVECLHHFEFEPGIHEASSQVSFHHIWQALRYRQSKNCLEYAQSYLWRVFGINPVIHCSVAFRLYYLDLFSIVRYLRLQRVTEMPKVSVETQSHSQRAQELVRYHRHLYAISFIGKRTGLLQPPCVQ